VLYSARLAERAGAQPGLHLTELQRFPTAGAHGVEHFAHAGRDYLAIPNYYGGDAAVYRWDGVSRFDEVQVRKAPS
jgi:hypothetical protein